MAETFVNLTFHLRKPYNEAKLLIEAFNQIIKEGGRSDISVRTTSKNSGKVLDIKLYRCKNSYAATSFGARILDTLEKEDFLNITKFNIGSVHYCPTQFFLEDCPDNERHGQILTVTMQEHPNKDIQEIVNRTLAPLAQA